MDPLIEKWAVLFKLVSLHAIFCKLLQTHSIIFSTCVYCCQHFKCLFYWEQPAEIKWIQFTELPLKRTSCTYLIIQGLKDNGLITIWFQIKERKTCNWRMDKIESFLPAAQRLDLLLFVVIVLGKRFFLYFFSH